MISVLNSAGRAHEASGASLFGSDLSRWPADVYDAQVLIQIQENIVERSISEAFQRRTSEPPQAFQMPRGLSNN